jgi:aminomethyltransferase
MELHRSPLHAQHVALDAKLVPFGGWEMPLAYPNGTIAEHRACRESAAAFDVSHLGTVRVSGPDAKASLQRAFTNDLDRIEPGRAQYTHLLDDEGSVLDDIIVWWLEPETFDVMPNASNTARVRDAVGSGQSEPSIEDITPTRAVIAVQGPQARALMSTVSPEAAEVGRFRVAQVPWAGTQMVVAGTGYTGEDGIECAVPAAAAAELWLAILDTGVIPAGLGARDTLRLEAGLPLHGNELGPGISPLQAGLGWVLRWDKGEFTGRSALERERAAGPHRILRGLAVSGRRPPRSGPGDPHPRRRPGRAGAGPVRPGRALRRPRGRPAVDDDGR